jgi:uncharacterized SAM-binding protein YcdF (DUF218 family)
LGSAKKEMSQNTSNRPNYQRRRTAFVVLLLLLVLAFFAGRNVGHWLIREDTLEHADAIVVLSGGLPYRAQRAAEIYAAGYAPTVWISYPAGPERQLSELGIHYVGEEEYNREILVHGGVPEKNVAIFPHEIINTEQEVDEIASEMRAQGKHTVIIVTSPQHTRRVRALWNSLAGRDLQAIVRAAPADPFDADHWWRNTPDSLAVMRESLGLLNVWSGLPVRPRR